MSLISEPQRRSPSPERVRGYKLERELDVKERTHCVDVDTTFGYIQSHKLSEHNADHNNNNADENHQVNKLNIQFSSQTNAKWRKSQSNSKLSNMLKQNNAKTVSGTSNTNYVTSYAINTGQVSNNPNINTQNLQLKDHLYSNNGTYNTGNKGS